MGNTGHSFYSPASITLGDLLHPGRPERPSPDEVKQEQMMQMEAAQKLVEMQCQRQLLEKYREAMQIGALMSPLGVKDATFVSNASSPMIMTDQYGRDERDLLSEGNRILDRIMFWMGVPLFGKWVAGILSEQLDSISGMLERMSERKLAHG